MDHPVRAQQKGLPLAALSVFVLAQKHSKMQKKQRKSNKNLHICEKSSTFAAQMRIIVANSL